jgi:thiol-disulfide isomerase/thioredoxin
MLALLVIVVAVGFWRLKKDNSPNVGADARSVAFLDADGGRHTLAEYAGKVVVVDVWATWCPPCRASLPEIAELQAASGDRYAVLPISVDNGGFGDVKAFLQQQTGQLAALKAYVPESRDALDAFGSITGIPTTILVDADGKIITRWSGYGPGQTEKALKEALK